MPLRTTTTMTGVTGAPYFSQMHFTGSTQTEADGAAAAVRAFWAAIVASMVSPLAIQVDAEVVYFDVGTGNPLGVFATSTAALSATGAGEPLPWATQALVRWRTGFFVGGREVRGRTFIPALTEGHNTAGRPVSALLTILNGAASALIADGSSQLLTYSPAHSATAPVVTGTAWTEWAQLRSRRE
jgi:hypothetical protein